MSELGANTQAILLLTAPLLVGTARRSARSAFSPLSDSEYANFALRLRELKCQPAALLGDQASDILAACADLFAEARMRALLARGFLLAQALERWQSRGFWVLSRADVAYPRRLKARLGTLSPPLLYGCGAVDAFERIGLAVLSEDDHAGVRSQLSTGGCAIVVLATSLERAALEVDYRAALIARRLTLVTPCDPGVDPGSQSPQARDRLVQGLVQTLGEGE